MITEIDYISSRVAMTLSFGHVDRTKSLCQLATPTCHAVALCEGGSLSDSGSV